MNAVSDAEVEQLLRILRELDEPLPPGLKERVWRRICERLGWLR